MAPTAIRTSNMWTRRSSTRALPPGRGHRARRRAGSAGRGRRRHTRRTHRRSAEARGEFGEADAARRRAAEGEHRHSARKEKGDRQAAGSGGSSGCRKATFTDPTVQTKLTGLSRRAQGRTQEEQLGEVLSNLRGAFVARKCRQRVSRASPFLCRARVELAGRYGLREEAARLSRQPEMEATLSQVAGGGVKGFFLKAIRSVLQETGRRHGDSHQDHRHTKGAEVRPRHVLGEARSGSKANGDQEIDGVTSVASEHATSASLALLAQDINFEDESLRRSAAPGMACISASLCIPTSASA